MRALLAATAVALLALVAAGPASAAGVSVSGATLTYNAIPGETNDLVVTLAAGTFTLTDAVNVAINPGAGCSNPENDNTATCGSAAVTRYAVTLGDKNDYVDMSSVPSGAFPGLCALFGGAGSDFLL